MTEIASLIQELEDAITSGTPKKQEKALTLVTDLFVAGSSRYTPDQIAVFGDVLDTLAATIAAKARVRLSRRLAGVANAPAKVIRSLAFDDAIAVAAPVLKQSAQLSEADLVANARTKSQDHLHAIAQRAELSEAVTDVLVVRGDQRVVHSVARNAGARFSHNGFEHLVARSRGDDVLTRYVGARKDLPRHHFLRLLETASSSVRESLEAANPGLAEAVREVVAEVATHISQEVRNGSRDHAKAKARVKRLCATRQFSEADVHAFARAQNFEQTAVALSVLGCFPIEIVERALLDPSPDMVLILARAAHCCWSTTKALLLMSAADRGMSPMDLDQAYGNFERLRDTTAKRAVNYYRARTAPAMRSEPAPIARFDLAG
jgi:uncharacterized protein (DUF2336 family)